MVLRLFTSIIFIRRKYYVIVHYSHLFPSPPHFNLKWAMDIYTTEMGKLPIMILSCSGELVVSIHQYTTNKRASHCSNASEEMRFCGTLSSVVFNA